MKIVMLRYLKQNEATLDVSDPLIVVKNGQPAYVNRIRQDESIALLKLMTLPEHDLEQGPTFRREQLLDNL